MWRSLTSVAQDGSLRSPPVNRVVGRLMVAMKIAIALLLHIVSIASITSGQERDRETIAKTGSMLPGIPINSRLVVDESFYSSRLPRRFDIVVVRRQYQATPETYASSMQIVARIVGLPGEVISIRSGRLYVNGRRQKEPFATKPCPDHDGEGFRCREMSPVRIPANQYFLLADNRPESEGSRLWSPKTIPRSNLVGKVVKIILPTATANVLRISVARRVNATHATRE